MRHFVLTIGLLSLSSSYGQIYTVTNTNDSGAGSLRFGVESASPGTSVYFDAGIAGQTITLATQITVPNSVFIYGQSNEMTISGGGNTRIFSVNGTYDFQLFDLVLANGSGGQGAAVEALNGALCVFERVQFINNNSSGDGGAIRGESANFTLKNCSFISNQCNFFGGAFSQLWGSCSMENVLFYGNKANMSGGGAYLRCDTDMRNVTFSGNFANNNGGAIFMYTGTAVDVYNSIFYNNATSSNPAGTPASFFELENGSTINIAVQNSIVQGSGGSGSWLNTFGFDGGGNLDANPLFVNQIAPTLAPTPAGDYRTQTGSPAHDSGANALSTIATDLDGHPRIINGTVDMGAFEFCSSFSTAVVTECHTYNSPAGHIYDSTGTYYDTIPNLMGCDSIITTQLNILGPTYNYLADSACGSYTSASGNYIWTTSGIHNDTLTNYLGCDSVIVTNLTILNPTYSTINTMDCFSYTSPSGNYTWTLSGIYYDTLTNYLGCDSIITINLTIPTSTTTIDTLICSPFTSPSGLYSWDQAGTYVDTVATSAGCDSVITINITVMDADNYLYFNGTDFSTDFLNGSFSWVWCDSTEISSNESPFFPDIPGDYALVIDNGQCIDTSDCIGINKDYSSVTGFSPNGDGVNDVLKLPILNESNTVTIFNRWGDEIITIEGYNNVDIVWDGADKSGDIIAGTYYYVIKGSITKAGWVQLLK